MEQSLSAHRDNTPMIVTDAVERIDPSDDEHEVRPFRSGRTLVHVAVLVVGVIALMGGILVLRGWRPSADGPLKMPTSPQMESEFGVRFTSVDVTAAGGMIQLRYQVLDTPKTAVVHDPATAPYVVDKNGKKYADPGMVGHTHVGPLKAAGTSDFILLANSGAGIHHGDVVTIKFGKYELRNVPVL